MILYGIHKIGQWIGQKWRTDRIRTRVKVWSYVAVALFTYGHAWTHYAPTDYRGTLEPKDSPQRIMGPIVMATVWPLYWGAGLAEVVWGEATPPLVVKSENGRCTATLKDGNSVSVQSTY